MKYKLTIEEKEILSKWKNRSDCRDYLLQFLAESIDNCDTHNSEHIIMLKLILSKIAKAEKIDFDLDDIEEERKEGDRQW